jgi:hypothetical protein
VCRLARNRAAQKGLQRPRVLLLLSRRFQKVCSRNKKGGSEAVWLQDFINRQQLRIAGYSNTQLLQLARTCAGVQPARQLALQLAQPLLRSLDKQPACATAYCPPGWAGLLSNRRRVLPAPPAAGATSGGSSQHHGCLAGWAVILLQATGQVL